MGNELAIRVLMATRGLSRAAAMSFSTRLNPEELQRLSELWGNKGINLEQADKVRQINTAIDQRFESEKATVDESLGQTDINFLPPG